MFFYNTNCYNLSRLRNRGDLMLQVQNEDLYVHLKRSADQILNVISKLVGVNTLCVASNDLSTSNIFSAFHRDEVLFEAGTTLSFYSAY